jgi:predicted HicB family RNase H-like nuclease
MDRKMAKTYSNLTVRVDPDLLKKIKESLQKKDRNLTEWINKSIKEYLEKEKIN